MKLLTEQEKQEILENFKTCGMDASYHYADDSGKEWHLAYPLVDKCMKLVKEHPEFHEEMREISKKFIFSMTFPEKDEPTGNS